MKQQVVNLIKLILQVVSNLASFVQYKETDDISWVIHKHRQLVTEILEYYGNKEKNLLRLLKVDLMLLQEYSELLMKQKIMNYM